MSNDIVLKMVFLIIGGLGIFLLGMRNLSDGLQTIAGDRLRKVIGMATPNRFMGVGVGTFVTCIIQSSSVTTVMTVGFVNAGLMGLHQAIGIIMGANIGTTMTGWMLAVSVDKYGLPIMGIAIFFYLFSKNEKLRYTAMAVMGVGMVFAGLEMMKNGFAPIRDIPEYIVWFQSFSADSYLGVIKCALAGCILTMIVQSSSATIGITMGLAATGVIPFETAAALVLGENLGTTVTAYLASIGVSTNAKRAAYAHVVFNMMGVIWITAIFGVYVGIIRRFIGSDPNTTAIVNDVVTYPYMLAAIAAVHTGFNLLNMAIFLPFTRVLADVLTKFVPDKPVKAAPRQTRLSRQMLDSPVVAIAQSRKEIGYMGKVDGDMFDMLRVIIIAEEVDEDQVKKLFKKENKLDAMQTEITSFLTSLLSGEVPRSLGQEAQKQIRLADEFETISDYMTSQLKLCLRIRNAGITIPDVMREELLELHDAVAEYFALVNRAYSERNFMIIAGAGVQGEIITQKVRDLRGRHVARLAETPIDPLLSTTFPDMLVSYRRVKEHVLNIAEVMIGKGGYAGQLPQHPRQAKAGGYLTGADTITQ
ncbi:MAG: Na/Pi cotransporter family protein [Chitinispirillales bacterium]|jgi:phosphate:Na+ symporter|nr:Na/Pi cotransporter family protein [Chitinispirillales bacterium]